MPRVVYNACHGGFSLSKKACKMLNKLKGQEVADPRYGSFYDWDFPRHDPDLVTVVDALGCKAASGYFAKLSIAEVKDKYRIREYDGYEEVETPEAIVWIEP